jgi:hypothetical protein
VQFHTDRTRRHKPHALPDGEVFWQGSHCDTESHTQLTSTCHVDTCYREAGYWYWYCFPGCLPDSDPIGPFPNIFRAVRDARQIMG